MSGVPLLSLISISVSVLYTVSEGVVVSQSFSRCARKGGHAVEHSASGGGVLESYRTALRHRNAVGCSLLRAVFTKECTYCGSMYSSLNVVVAIIHNVVHIVPVLAYSAI